jgi:hypothetical protein
MRKAAKAEGSLSQGRSHVITTRDLKALCPLTRGAAATVAAIPFPAAVIPASRIPGIINLAIN